MASAVHADNHHGPAGIPGRVAGRRQHEAAHRVVSRRA